MAATGYTPIQLYRTSTAAATPSAGNLADGELAINLTDEKLYFKNASGVVKMLASVAGATGTVSSVALSGGTTGLTTSGGPITTSGTITLAGTLGVANGGTGATSLASGYLLKGNGTSAVSASVVYDDGTNVGIGTSSPGAKLDVVGTSAVSGTSYFGDNMLLSRTNTAGSISGITITNGGTTGAYAGININSGTVSTQLFNDAAGNAVVAGAILRTTSNHPIVFGTNATERMRLDASGNLGIGTSSPTQKLHVIGNTLVPINNSYYCYTSDYGIGTPDGSGLQVFASNGDVLRFGHRTGGTTFTENMRIASNGNVGIGTSSPSAKLHVVGDTYVQSGTIFTDVITSYGGTSLTLNGGSTLIALTSGTERMRLDASGNLGLGVTPSAWSGVTALQMASSSAIAFNNQYGEIESNAYYNGGYKYIGTGLAAKYAQSAGVHQWYTAPSGTAGNAISFTQAMTLDASGRLLVGTTTGVGSDFTSIRFNSGGSYPQGLNMVDSNASANGTVFQVFRKSDDTYLGSIKRNGTDNAILVNGNSYLALGSGDTERARIDSSGNFGIGTSSPGALLHLNTAGSGDQPRLRFTNGTTGTGATDGCFVGMSNSTQLDVWNFEAAEVRFGTGNQERARIDSSGNLLVGTTTSGPYTARFAVKYAGATVWSVGPTDTTDSFYVASSVSTGVYLTAAGTSWTSNSDERIKDIIEPISDAAAKVSSLRAVIGKFKSDEDGTRRSFLIAQDVQAVLPEAVSVKDDEMGTLGLQYSEVIPLLVAAINELTARVAQLEGN